MDRYTPFESMDRMFEQMRRSMWDAQPGRQPMALPVGSEDVVAYDEDDFALGTRNVRLEPTDEGYVAMADLPGFETEDITVTFDDGVLSIAAHQEASDDDEETIRRHARTVRESLRIPGKVDVDAISGTYRNGVLEVTLPTFETPEDDAHVIDIE